MKKRYLGVFHLAGDGGGVIELVGEEYQMPSPERRPHKTVALGKSPS